MRFLALSVAFVLLAGLAGAQSAKPASWPTSSWTQSTPAAEGMDAGVLEALHAEFEKGAHGYVDGMLVIRNGRIVFEKSYTHDYVALFAGKDPKRGPYNYYDPDWHPYYEKTRLHTMQSVSKSVTATLIGIALQRGELAGVDVRVMPFFKGFRIASDARWQALTLRQLLTMQSGIRWDESTIPYTDPNNSCARMEASQDWVQFVLEQPMATEPGRVFVYNSGVTQLLAQTLLAATGKQPDDYAVEHLFKPLGITEFYWKRTPTRLPDAEGGLYLLPRDLAKLGLLYMKDGVWDGRRILPAGWVKEATAPAVATVATTSDPRARRYGFQWWALPRADDTTRYAYAALGYGGQRLIVVPERELIAVFTGWNIYDKPEFSPRTALDRVLAAVR